MDEEKRKKALKITSLAVAGTVAVSWAATKLIYDICFPRFDVDNSEFVNAYPELVASRKQINFASSGNSIAGYLYGGNGDGGILVVLAPGLAATADGYLPQISCFLEEGFGVFAFDTTGSGESEGENSVGFPQELLDLSAALDVVTANGKFGYDKTVLFGHSRGGYAVCCVLADHRVDAAVSVSGLNSAMEGVTEPARKYAGNIVYANYPFLWAYQTTMFDPKTVNADATTAINASGTPVLVIHGSNDQTVSCEKSSIYAHRGEITSLSAEFLLYERAGHNGHTDLLFDGETAPNRELMDIICDFYKRSVKK